MKYLQKSFSSGAPSQAYRDNFDRIFRSKAAEPAVVSESIILCQAQADGVCVHSQCPQTHDSEPEKSGRECPLKAHAP